MPSTAMPPATETPASETQPPRASSRRGYRLRPFDIAAIFATLTATVVSSLAVYRAPHETVPAFRIQAESGRYTFPHDASERISVAGTLGSTVVELSDGRARILSSPCAAQTCVHAPPIERAGQWTACLPNGVFVSLDRGGGAAVESDDDALDALAW